MILMNDQHTILSTRTMGLDNIIKKDSEKKNIQTFHLPQSTIFPRTLITQKRLTKK